MVISSLKPVVLNRGTKLRIKFPLMALVYTAPGHRILIFSLILPLILHLHILLSLLPPLLMSSWKLFYLEIAVESHEVLRNRELPYALYPRPAMATSVVQHHNKEQQHWDDPLAFFKSHQFYLYSVCLHVSVFILFDAMFQLRYRMFLWQGTFATLLQPQHLPITHLPKPRQLYLCTT